MWQINDWLCIWVLMQFVNYLMQEHFNDGWCLIHRGLRPQNFRQTWMNWMAATALSAVSEMILKLSVSFPVRRVTLWSTTLWETRSGWVPASQRMSTCHRSGAPPACWAHGKLAPTIFSACASVATTPVKRCPWSWGRSCRECFILSPLSLWNVLFVSLALQIFWFPTCSNMLFNLE